MSTRPSISWTRSTGRTAPASPSTAPRSSEFPPLDQGDGGGAVTTDGDYVGTVGIITTGDGGGGGSIVADPTIDTTGAGSVRSGAAVTFAGPGSIDGDEALAIDAGSGAISLGALGDTTPLGPVTFVGGSVSLSGIFAVSVTITATPPPSSPDVTFSFAPNPLLLADTITSDQAQSEANPQQSSGAIYPTSLLDNAANRPPLLTILPMPLPPGAYGPADTPDESAR